MSKEAEAFISAINEEATCGWSPGKPDHRTAGLWASVSQGYPPGGYPCWLSDLENTRLYPPALISLSLSKLWIVLGFSEEFPIRGDTL